MWIVKTEYPDYTKLDNKSRILLNADQGFNPYTWEPPINWKGFVGGVEVEFVQINSSGSSKIDYDFSSLPKECMEAVPYIIEAIDNAMRVMD